MSESKFAVGDIVVIAKKAPKNPQAMVNLYVGRDARVLQIAPNDKGDVLLRVEIFEHMVPPTFWVSEDMLEPEVTDAMRRAGEKMMIRLEGLAVATSEPWIPSEYDLGLIYSAMRAVRRDKSKVSSA